VYNRGIRSASFVTSGGVIPKHQQRRQQSNNNNNYDYDDKWIRTRAAVASPTTVTMHPTGSLVENATLNDLGDERLSVASAQHNGFYFEHRHA